MPARPSVAPVAMRAATEGPSRLAGVWSPYVQGMAGRHIDALTCRRHTAGCQRGPLEK
jgi:hypothetical protein